MCASLSAEPKVVFAKEQSAHSEVKAMAGASATLSCEVAQAQTEVTWYKDGKKLSGSSKVRVEATGCTRRLVLQQAAKGDSGEYSCEAGGQKVTFHLDVPGQFFGGTNLALCVGSDYSRTHPVSLSTGLHLFNLLSSISHIIPVVGPDQVEWAECEQKGEVILYTRSGAQVLLSHGSQHLPEPSGCSLPAGTQALPFTWSLR